MGLFSRKPPKLPSFAGVPLDSLLADPAWSEPLDRAGIAASRCQLVHVVDNVMVAARNKTFSDGMPFLTAGPAVVFVQGDTLALAVPDEREVLVIKRAVGDGRLMLTRFGAIQVVFGSDATVDGWTFDGLKKDTAQGKAFGDELHRFVMSG